MQKKAECRPAVRGLEERNALVVENLRLVPWALLQYRPRLSWAARALGGWRDAIQVGRLGLIRAAELWEPSRGAFSTYAVHWVRGKVRKAARRAWREGALLAGGIPHPGPPATGPCDAPDGEALTGALRTLTGREREVVRLRFGLTPDRVPHTLEEVARVFNVTDTRVSQIEKDALRKLRRGGRADVLAPLAGLWRCRSCGTWARDNRHCRDCGACGCGGCVDGQGLCPKCREVGPRLPAAAEEAAPPQWPVFPFSRLAI
jgi:RNA polymerase sigma factor (sigma-70 family)